MASEVQTLTLAGKTFVILERSEYERLQAVARTAEDAALPALPEPDSRGNYPAVPYARASLARRAGIRQETLSRLEKGESTPDVATVDKIVRVLERAEAATRS